jgi:hypothetical protein
MAASARTKAIFLKKPLNSGSFIDGYNPTPVQLVHIFGLKTGGKNILEARYLAVNRLASKCIQSLGLNTTGQLLGLNQLRNNGTAVRSFVSSVFENGYPARTKVDGMPYLLSVCR